MSIIKKIFSCSEKEEMEKMDAQELMYFRAETVEKIHESTGFGTRMKYISMQNKCDKVLTKKLKEGGRCMLTTCYTNIPCDIIIH